MDESRESKALPGPDVKDIDKEIFQLHNDIRQNPKSFVEHLEDLKDKFDGMLLRRPGKVTLRTKEGVDAVNSAIDYLNGLEPVKPLRWCAEVAAAAKDHCDDIGPRGLIQHDSSNGRSGVKERLRKYGNIVSCYGENLSFHCDDAKEVMIQLIVDDGVQNRGHRENIFNPEFTVMGCFSSDHKDFNSMTTLDYAGAFIVAGEPDPIERQMDEFLKEEVDFPDMPDNVRSWKQNSKISVQGNMAKKTTTRTCKLKDNTEKVLTKVLERKFDL